MSVCVLVEVEVEGMCLAACLRMNECLASSSSRPCLASRLWICLAPRE